MRSHKCDDLQRGLRHFLRFILRTTVGVNACVAVVKCHPVLHQCVLIFCWSSRIIDCIHVFFTFENRVPEFRSCAMGLLMNSFNKIEAAISQMQIMVLEEFLFSFE